MKTGMLFSAIFLGGMVLSAGSVIAEDQKGAESIDINGGDRGTITFPHGRHQGIFVDCLPCHDLFPKEAQIIEKLKDDGKLKKKVVMNMCKKCHKDLAKKGQKTGPIACKDCHKK